jgi:hypothetical protein
MAKRKKDEPSPTFGRVLDDRDPTLAQRKLALRGLMATALIVEQQGVSLGDQIAWLTYCQLKRHAKTDAQQQYKDAKTKLDKLEARNLAMAEWIELCADAEKDDAQEFLTLYYNDIEAVGGLYDDSYHQPVKDQVIL